MGKLSTHVLDITQGRPGAGVKLALYAVNGNGRELLKTAVTNADGRCDAPLLEGASLKTGKYELVFSAGAYFDAQGVSLPTPRRTTMCRWWCRRGLTRPTAEADQRGLPRYLLKKASSRW